MSLLTLSPGDISCSSIISLTLILMAMDWSLPFTSYPIITSFPRATCWTVTYNVHYMYRLSQGTSDKLQEMFTESVLSKKCAMRKDPDHEVVVLVFDTNTLPTFAHSSVTKLGVCIKYYHNNFVTTEIWNLSHRIFLAHNKPNNQSLAKYSSDTCIL